MMLQQILLKIPELSSCYDVMLSAGDRNNKSVDVKQRVLHNLAGSIWSHVPLSEIHTCMNHPEIEILISDAQNLGLTPTNEGGMLVVGSGGDLCWYIVE
jgi:hypothetical protein